VSYRAVLYRIASTQNMNNVWARFQGEYRRLTGKTLLGTEEPHRFYERTSGHPLHGLVSLSVSTSGTSSRTG
jgi:hypothetical protein